MVYHDIITEFFLIVNPLTREHLEELENEGETNLYTWHQKEFPRWFLQRASAFVLQQVQFVFYHHTNSLQLHNIIMIFIIICYLQISQLVQVMNLSIDESTVLSSEIIDLVKGPQKTISRMSGCTINGHRFHTKVRERRRKSQNSGVLVQGDHQGEIIDFYGVLIDIIELYYIGRNRVLIFKCDWWDVGNKRRINVDEFGFVSVNVNKTWYKDQPIVLASQAQQVFYVNDLKLGKDWRVVESFKRDIFMMYTFQLNHYKLMQNHTNSKHVVHRVTLWRLKLMT